MRSSIASRWSIRARRSAAPSPVGALASTARAAKAGAGEDAGAGGSVGANRDTAAIDGGDATGFGAGAAEVGAGALGRAAAGCTGRGGGVVGDETAGAGRGIGDARAGAGFAVAGGGLRGGGGDTTPVADAGGGTELTAGRAERGAGIVGAVEAEADAGRDAGAGAVTVEAGGEDTGAVRVWSVGAGLAWTRRATSSAMSLSLRLSGSRANATRRS